MQTTDLIESFLKGLRPTPSLKVWEWADKYRMLSSVSSAEAGQWRTSRVPYMFEIFDKLSPTDPCREVDLMKGVQIAGTEAALNLVGCYIDIEPCPIMYVMPTVDMAKQLSKKRMAHLISECSSLNSKIAGMHKKVGGSSMLEKSFAGGSLSLTGANSASGLRSNPVRVLALDEVDAYPLNLEGEGSPVKLAEARTSTFSRNKKIFRLSTPTVSGASVIERNIEKSDKRLYHVPCPHCKEKQPLKFENLKWDDKDPETAKYACEHCGVLIEERYKTWMLSIDSGAEWIPSKPENTSKYRAGYAINSLYSPLGWISWAEIARKFMDEKDDPILFKTFVNTILGEPWAEKGESPDWEIIFGRREDYRHNVPPNVVEMITAGVDVQKDRLELEIVGWCRNKQTYSIDYRVLIGDTTESEVWDSLSEVINETWLRPDGTELVMNMMCIDSGYNTSIVYDFCRGFSPNKVVPIKGQDNMKTIVSSPRNVDVGRSGKKVGKVKVWSVGSSVIKSEIYSNLKLSESDDGVFPDRYCHFPEYPVEFFKGMTAEVLKYKMVNGFRKYGWVKEYLRNEPLDCRVYARAAANLAGFDRMNDRQWDALLGQYKVVKTGHDTPQKRLKKRKPKKKSDFWAGR